MKDEKRLIQSSRKHLVCDRMTIKETVLNGVKLVFDFKMKNQELLGKCRQTANEVSEFYDRFMEVVFLFEGYVNEGIVPPENMDKILEFLCDYSKGVKNLSGLLCDYINSAEGIEESSASITRMVLLDQKIGVILKERTYFCGNDFLAMERTLIEGKERVAYWCKQKWIDSQRVDGLEDYVHIVRERHGRIVWILNNLTDCIEKHLSEMMLLQRDMSMACVYASPEIMMNSPQICPDEQTYPYIHSIENGNEEDNLMMEEIYGSPDMILDYQNEQKGIKEDVKEIKNRIASVS